MDTIWKPIDSAPVNELVLLYCPDLGCPTNQERIELDYASHGRQGCFSHHAWATLWAPLPPFPIADPEASNSV